MYTCFYYRVIYIMVKRRRSRRVKTRRKTRRKAHRRSHRGPRGPRGHLRRKTRIRRRRRELDSRAAGLADGNPFGTFGKGYDRTWRKGVEQGYGNVADSLQQYIKQNQAVQQIGHHSVMRVPGSQGYRYIPPTYKDEA